ncbi:GspE/PulE family protein [Candidatus Dependentiae bacterium]|nr:GspE/PulE family protein [Candidatus Dependentiae bacterium]
MTHQREIKSVIEFVDDLIRQAIFCRASDIHLEPLERGLRIRFRIDGVLHEREWVSPDSMLQVISRIKVLANIDIAERRIPQDGSFSRTIERRMIDFRVSTFPTLLGEKLVIRILDRTCTAIALDALGLGTHLRVSLLDVLERKNGLFLVTGPTGSGKTTTLYAALSHLNNTERHIITLEDPVEYHLSGITQGHIHPGAGFSFAKGMRALLRQDPDILMVGEIRDRETANIALEAALTGHLVLSTVHTADAPRVIMRLMDMQIEPFKISAALVGILAQRLVRALCSSCKVKRHPTSAEQAFLISQGKDLAHVYDAHGCDACQQIGYVGRVGIFQLLTMTENICSLLGNKPTLDALQYHAHEDGMQTLYQDGLEKVAEGVTSISELIKAAA